MILTITKAKDRIGLMTLFRKLERQLSLSEVKSIIDNLDVKPYIDDPCYLDDWAIAELDKFAEFNYEPSKYDDYWAPAWKKPEYMSARNWYDSLSNEDRKKIDILISAHVPACYPTV